MSASYSLGYWPIKTNVTTQSSSNGFCAPTHNLFVQQSLSPSLSLNLCNMYSLSAPLPSVSINIDAMQFLKCEPHSFHLLSSRRCSSAAASAQSHATAPFASGYSAASRLRPFYPLGWGRHSSACCNNKIRGLSSVFLFLFYQFSKRLVGGRGAIISGCALIDWLRGRWTHTISTDCGLLATPVKGQNISWEHQRENSIISSPFHISPDLVHAIPLVLYAGRAFSLQSLQVVQKLQVVLVHLLQLLVVVGELLKLLVVAAQRHCRGRLLFVTGSQSLRVIRSSSCDRSCTSSLIARHKLSK